MKEKSTATKKKPHKAGRKKQVPVNIAPADIFNRKENRLFPIVGIGASAGGLEALELFLSNVPEGSGMAFVIVQHLDPTHKGIMVELLQRTTAMPVFQVKDRLAVKPEHVYVIPPNRDMSLLHGVLHLLEPVVRRGLRLPIDFFLRSLAEDQQERSIGVILSGMGSDGTLGLRAIKEKAGVAFVQSPASAKFDGMPGSAIDAGLADVIAPVEELPGKIIAYLKHAPLVTGPRLDLDDKSQSGLEKIVILLRRHTGHDFSMYKKTTVYRRIERRMGIHQIERISTYVRFLQENSQEIEMLFKELLIGVTNFFRDPAAWEQLQSEVIPVILTERPADKAVRVWVPGCSTGEEAYSLAIVLKEALEQNKVTEKFALQVFATDLDRDAIEKAREGIFPANIAADVSAERMNRFFVKVERGYQVTKPIREMVIFAPQNIIMDPPFTKLDIVSCRNVLIYLTPELQKQLLPLFHYSLNPGGFLFLGSAETVGGFTDLFVPLRGRSRIYRRAKSVHRSEPINFPPSFSPALPGNPQEPKALKAEANLQSLVDQMLLQRYSPPAVLVNDNGDIIYISGRTGKYLEPAAGKANWNIFAMVREELRYELISAFQQACWQRALVIIKGVKVGTNGGVLAVDVAVQPLEEPEALRGMVIIVFTDVATAPETKGPRSKTKGTPAGSDLLARMEQELNQARQELRSRLEEMQTAQEELKSAYEELQSTNEELQSTNEELTTSREEMQSLNEELQTVNYELQAKAEDLSRASDDMKNMLDSTGIAILFLDNALRVRRFTAHAGSVTKLIPVDVGRPITDIASELFYPELVEDVGQVLRTLASSQKQLNVRDGRWFGIRIIPYRTVENVIDGVVITFMEITAFKTLEAKLKRNAEEKGTKIEER